VTELEKGSHITQLETQLTIAMQENENKMSRISTLEKQNRNLQMEVGQLRSVHKGESLDAVDPIPGTIRRSDRLAPRNQPTKAGSSGVQEKLSFVITSGMGKSFKNEFDPSAPADNYEFEGRLSRWGASKSGTSPLLPPKVAKDNDLLTPGIQRQIDPTPTGPSNQKPPKKPVDIALRLFSEYHKLFWDDVGPRSFLYTRLNEDEECIRAQIRAFLLNLKQNFIASAKSLREEFEGMSAEEVSEKLPELLFKTVMAYRAQLDRFRKKVDDK